MVTHAASSIYGGFALLLYNRRDIMNSDLRNIPSYIAMSFSILHRHLYAQLMQLMPQTCLVGRDTKNILCEWMMRASRGIVFFVKIKKVNFLFCCAFNFFYHSSRFFTFDVFHNDIRKCFQKE